MSDGEVRIADESGKALRVSVTVNKSILFGFMMGLGMWLAGVVTGIIQGLIMGVAS